MEMPLRFLVVEDDRVDTAALRGMLGPDGPGEVVDAVSSLYDAKKKIRSGSYDLVVLDLSLPDSQGLDSVIDLQATAPEIPIVVVSGDQGQHTALQAMGIGAEDF